MDLSKLIDLIAEVAVRRAVQKEAKDKATPEAVLDRVLGFIRFTSGCAAIYRSRKLPTDPLLRWCP
jgi:hypothetical protein